MTSQREAIEKRDIDRVAERISAVVLEFFATPGRRFHMGDLYDYVRRSVAGPTAPDSAGRIMRALRKARKIHYEVVDRSASLYEVLAIEPTQTEFPGFDEVPAKPSWEYPD